MLGELPDGQNRVAPHPVSRCLWLPDRLQASQRSRAVDGNQHPLMKREMDVLLHLVKVGDR